MEKQDFKALIQQYRWLLPSANKFYDWPSGWDDIVVQLIKDLQEEIRAPNYVQLVQIKEKFGQLRILFHEGTDSMKEKIKVAEEKSRMVCQQCGAPGGEFSQGHRYYTLCPDCATAYEKT
jgi:Zn finger protein HypA/HybF involved in hydrogenase expression